MSTPHVQRLRLAVTAACCAATLAACGSSSTPASGGATGSAATETAPSSPAQSPAVSYPVTLDNCGRTLTIDAAPKRVVSLNQSSTELLLTLGVGDRVVGTSTWFDPVLPALKQANDRIPRIAANNPSLEAVLAKEPDLAVATWRADLPGEGASTIADLARLGLPVYMSPEECAKAPDGAGDGRRDRPMTMDMVYQQIDELGRIMGVPERGTQLVAQVRKEMSDLGADQAGKGKRVAFWFADSEAPYVAGGVGAPEITAKALGMRNVFDDSSEEWPQVSWEAFAQRDPDLLVLGDLTRDRMTTETGAAKITFLKSNPVTREMTAVRKDRFVLLPGSDMNGGLRIPDATRALADGLKKVKAP